MLSHWPTYVALFFSLLTACGLAYLLLAMFGALRFLNAPQPPKFTPAVSILKPLRGFDRDMYEAFRSHCHQDYPEYEIIFGVWDLSDSAVPEVERLRAEFPDHQIKLVVCPERLGTNGKASTLAQMMRQAKYDYVLVNDSDIRVEPTYLRTVMSHFSEAKVGMATALYRAHAGDSLSSRIEAVGIATDFVGGVLSATIVESGLHFALGSTLAIRRDVLNQIGGFEAIANYLADDYELGARTSRAGYKVALSSAIVETHLPSYGLKPMFEHQLRWARTIRDMRKGGYVSLLFTFPLVWAALAAIIGKFAAPFVVVLLTAAFVRFVAAWTLAGPVLRDRHTLRDLWLVPVRDFFGLVVWAASFASDEIVWRGERFHLKDGMLVRAD